MPLSTKERCPPRAWLLALLCLMLAAPGGWLDRPVLQGSDDAFELIARHVIADLPGSPAEATGYTTDLKQTAESEAISPALPGDRRLQAWAGLRQTAHNSSWHSRDHLPVLPRPPCTL